MSQERKALDARATATKTLLYQLAVSAALLIAAGIVLVNLRR